MVLQVAAVREYLEDIPAMNYKHLTNFFTDQYIERSMEWARKEADAIPPLDSASGNTLPDFIILIGTVSQMFRRRSLNVAINFAPDINENGLNVPTGSEYQLYSSIANEYGTLFNKIVYEYKRNKNINETFTNIKSPYDAISKNRGIGTML